MSSEPPTASEWESETDRLLLVLEAGRNRDLLSEWLGSFPEYEVTVVGPGEEVPPYDLCIVHESVLPAVESLLAERKRAADPVHLPHLLLRPAGNGDRDADWGLVDDVVVMPAEQPALRRRVENLLQARRASLRLREREDQYQRLVELTPEGILLVDDGTVVYANTAAVELLRVGDASDLFDRPLREFVVDDDEASLGRALAAIEDDEDPSSYTEVRFETAVGTVVHTSVAGVRVTYEGRPVTQLVVRDLTERRARQRQLDLFGRAIDSAAQGITIADAQQDDEPLVYANDAFERITGYDKDEVLGRNCRFLQGANTDEETVGEIRAAIDARRPVSVELLNYRKDGTPFWNHLDIVPVEDDGEVSHFLGLQRDITDRKEREQRVAVLDRVLRHNIRNQTGVIRGYAELLAGEDRVGTVAGQIRDAADDLLTISEQVRAFRSVVTGEKGQIETVDLIETLEEAVDGLRAAGGAIEVTGPDAVTVRADPTLPAALRDLVELAGRSTDPDVSIAVTEADDRAVVELTDRGGGLSPEDLRVVAGSTETALDHLQGIDLWLVRWSVEQSDGEFGVDLDGDPTVRLRFIEA